MRGLIAILNTKELNQFGFAIDELSLFFIALISIIAVITVFYLVGYASKYKGKYSITLLYILSALFPLSMIGVVAANNVFNFMFCWELMSLVSYFLVIYDFKKTENIKAGFAYFIMTHLSAIFLFAGFLSISAIYNWDMNFDTLQTVVLESGLKSQLLIFSLFFLGSAIKMGLIPFHFWLPLAHPAAPSNVSAMMSGLMVKLPIYLLIKLSFDFWGADLAIGYTMLIFGIISMLRASLYAAFESNIKRLLAYSTIENVGFCLSALGFSIIFQAFNQNGLASIALLTCLFHTLNHALFKTNLFLGAGAIIKATHQSDLNKMGGLIHNMPISSILFLFSVFSAAGIPFFNGFVGEWIIYQLSISGMHINSSLSFFTFPIALLFFAMVAGIVFLIYARLYSIAFLGYARDEKVQKAKEVNFLLLLPSITLAGICFYIGINPNSLNFIWKDILHSFNLPFDSTKFLANLNTITLANNGNNIPINILIISIIVLLLIQFLFNTLVAKQKFRREDPWACGQLEITSTMQYSASGFSQPLRRLTKAVSAFSLSKVFVSFYDKFCSHSSNLRESLHNHSLQRYLLYITLTLIGGIIYAKHF